MRLEDFDFALPPELIAQEPPADRAGARMLVIHRETGVWRDRMFRDLPSCLNPDDLLVLNNTRVFPSRLIGSRSGHSGRVELFLCKPLTPDRKIWDALVRPGRKVLTGAELEFPPDLRARILTHGEHGHRTVELTWSGSLDDALERTGHIPLPPYIHRPDTLQDRDRYQSVFAQEKGSIAAPTASLHFTPEILAALPCPRAEVTLHVGLGTFEPLRSAEVEQNELHAESYQVDESAWSQIQAARRVIAVGTTSTRTLESVARTGQLAGDTSLFLYPGSEFKITGGMLTNFHLPQSSLLLLVCAFGGTSLMLAAYEHAVQERYRFFSYGDCMLIL